jgi:hypothetical protein
VDATLVRMEASDSYVHVGVDVQAFPRQVVENDPPVRHVKRRLIDLNNRLLCQAALVSSKERDE